MPQGWTPVATAPTSAPGWTPVAEMPHYQTANEKDAQGNAVVDPNTIGTYVKHLWDGINPVQLGQLLPFPKALGGSGLDNPLNPATIVKNLAAVKKQAQAALAKGDYVGAFAKYTESVLPILGPMMAQQGNELQGGQYAAAAGDMTALAANAAVPGLLKGRSAPRVTPNTGPPEVAFGQARGVPLDAATVSNNFAVKGAQQLADRSLGGSIVATPATAARTAAMGRVGDELATEAHPVPVTPEQAGTVLRRALTEKMEGHSATANQAYERIRSLEQEPTNHMTMPGKPASIDGLPDAIRGQLRRIVHELDAAPYTKRTIIEGKFGGEQVRAEGTGGAGATVFDDIVQRSGLNTTRGALQNQLETYIAGGPETPNVKAAIEVAVERNKGRGGYTVSKPELGTNALDEPTRLEAGRVQGQDMGFPVDLKEVKRALQPIYDQMKRQLPITQQQASPGLKAIENVVQGEDFAPLSQVDRDLSAIKAVARKQGGLAKFAVQKLDAAVRHAAAMGGPEVVKALEEGRAATTAKYATADVLESLHDEPVRTITALTAPKDAAIQALRTIQTHVPTQLPVVARAYLEDLLAKSNTVAEWRKLGSETKSILFPKAGQAQALDHFFALTDRISKTNVNPSGSGYVASLGAQGAMLWYDPLHAIPLQISGAVLTKLLRSPVAIRALTRGLQLPASTPVAIRSAATGNLLSAARAAGVDLGLPKAADQQPAGSAQR